MRSTWGAMVVALLGSCSFGGVEPTVCERHVDCRDAFGFGWTCEADGYCAPFQVEPRCARTTPQDLLTREDGYPGAILLGAVSEAPDDLGGAAVQLAVAQARGGGGLASKDLGLVQCHVGEDATIDALDREQALDRALTYLVEVVEVHAIVGPTSPDMLALAWERLEGTGVALVSPSAPGVDFAGLEPAPPTDEAPGLLWRTTPSHAAEAAALAIDLRDRIGAADVAVLAEDTAYGAELSAAFVSAFGDGVHTTRAFPYATAAERDAAVGAVGDLSASTALLLVTGSLADAIAVLDLAAGDAGHDGRAFVLTGAAGVPGLVDGVEGGSARLAQVTGTRVPPPGGPVFQAFRTSFVAAHGTDPVDHPGAAYAFDAAWLVLHGAAWSWYQEGGVTGAGVARGLRRVSDGDAIQIGPASWPQVQTLFETGTGIDVSGASGPLDFDPATEDLAPHVELWAIDGVDVVIEGACDGASCCYDAGC